MTDNLVWKASVMLTASSVMNLYASGQIESMLATLPVVAACEESVFANEQYCIYAGPDEEVIQKKDAVDIWPLVEKNLLHLVAANGQVLETAARIAALGMIDDGETIPCAIALQYDWMLVTDDPYALDLFMVHLPGITCVSTIDIVKYWVETCWPTTQVIKKAVGSMDKRALYKPSVSHRWYPWWNMWNGYA
jgi:hypothetical protein